MNHCDVIFIGCGARRRHSRECVPCGRGVGLFALRQRHNDTDLKHLTSILRNLPLASGLPDHSGALMQKLASNRSLH